MTTDTRCIDCNGTGKYPSGETCQACGGSGQVAEEDGIFVRADEVLRVAMDMKKRMLKHGFTHARITCPRCGGEIRARLAGRKNHIHMACTGNCGMAIME